MQFKKLILQNIRSYENLDLEFPRGSSLLSGDIGSGKTSVLLGLQFALFGLQPGQKGASILRQGEDSAYSCLKLEIDHEIIKLERTIKKSKSGSITQDSQTITMNNKSEELSTLEMKERVITLLNYPKEFAKKSNLLYKFTVYTPQEEMKTIVQEKPEIRLNTLRHIFGIDKYKRIKENAQILIKKIKESIKLKEVLVSELNLIKEKLAIENENKIKLTRETNNLNIDYKNLILEKQKSEDKLSTLQKILDEVSETTSELEKTQILFQNKKNSEERIKREIALMQKEIAEKFNFSQESLSSLLELLDKHRKTLEEKNIKFLKLNSEVSVLNSRKEQPLELKNKIVSLENCPTCLQTVSQDHKTRIGKKLGFEIEDINRELEQKLKQKELIVKEIESEKKLISNYELDKAKLQQDKIKSEHQRTIQTKIQSEAFILDRTSNEIKELKSKLEEYKTKIAKFSSSQNQFDDAKKEFQNINEITRVKEIKMATKSKELELLKIKLTELQEEIQAKEKIREQVNDLRKLQDWIQKNFITLIDITEKSVMLQIKNEFSEIFSKWFADLVSDSLSVRLDEEFTPIITNQDYEMDYDFLSGGERTAIALAYRLSLNQVLNSRSNIKTKGIVILDEPTDGFSSEQIDKMRDIFSSLNSEQMILVSHEEKIDGFVDHVIRIQKDGISRIESNN
jgi:DNA repair protein SbcC/Rad50